MNSKTKAGQERHCRKRNELLGMNHTVAMKRLYRMLILRYMQFHGHDSCFKCGKKIENIETLSIEHKEPWFNSADPVKTFWDMDNLAFSHIRCNTREGGHRSKGRTEGMEWCSRCKQFLPVDHFTAWNNGVQRRSVSSYCTKCKSEYSKEYHARKRFKIAEVKKEQSFTDSGL